VIFSLSATGRFAEGDKMFRSRKYFVAAVAGLLFMGSGSAFAAESETDPITSDDSNVQFFLPRSGREEVFPQLNGFQNLPPNVATPTALCVFQNAVDSLHYSSTATSFGTISVHGWWRNGNCKATKAVVTTQLQKKNRLGLWFDVGLVGRKTVFSGGGSANRSNSRYECVAHENNEYRAWVDVDVVGVADLPGRIYTPVYTFKCD
jgi:hypothetical protein